MKDVIKELLPPDDHGRPLSPLTRWRIAVFAVCTTFVVFMVWAVSPWGFARAGDMNDVKSDMNDVRMTQTEQMLYDAKESECASTDSNARRFFSNRVMQLSREYFKRTGIQVSIPPCRSREKADE